jgi:hypothetical protein
MMLEWLLAPIDATRLHVIAPHVAGHARLMVLAWAVLFPLGVLAARFFKIAPRQRWPEQLDNQAWWRVHLGLQYTAGAALLIGLWLIWAPGSSAGSRLHVLFGWATIASCSVQFLGGWLRGSKGGPTEPRADGSWSGDHYDMSRRRRMFEYVHKSLGYLAMLLSVGAVLTGLWHVDALRWIWLALAGWWCVLVASFIVLQRGGWAVDTYQAIWGPDPVHPGNKLTPIGWGVRRPVPPTTNEHTG